MSDETKHTPAQPARSATPEPPPGVVVRMFGTLAIGRLLNFMTLLVAVVLAMAGVFLTVAWHSGPQLLIERAQYRSFTSHADSRIVDSWLALEIDEEAIKVPANWRASAKASPCVVVEIEGEWASARRHAFCGNRLKFSESYDVVNQSNMAPQVPFAWPRDARGFAVAEVRMTPASHAWLVAHEPNRFMHDKWPAKSALDWLRLEVDSPVDAAIAGWQAPRVLVPIAFDPRHPDGVLPAGIVASRLAGSVGWIAVATFAVMGLALWFWAAFALPLFADTSRAGKVILGALPLLALPWWQDYLPSGLTAFDSRIASVARDIFGDMDPTDRLVATPPDDASLATGERITWRPGEGAYADTFGRFNYAAPRATPANANAALTALADSLTAQARVLPLAQRIALMDNLRRDTLRDLNAASIVFLPAAREALVDPQSDPALARAARQFLVEWARSSWTKPQPSQTAYDARLELVARLKDVPVPEIAGATR